MLAEKSAAKLVIFDWNGTLLADAQTVCDGVNQVLSHLDRPPITLQRFRDTAAIPAFDFYVSNGCSRDELVARQEECARIFHTFYEPRAARCRCRGGARELLSWLRSVGAVSIIVSNHTVSGIEAQLKRLKLEDYFFAVVANTDLGSANQERTKQARVAAFLQDHGWRSENTLSVGDAPEEVDVARALGITCAAISGGHYALQRLRTKQPDYLVHSLFELKTLLQEKVWAGVDRSCPAQPT